MYNKLQSIWTKISGKIEPDENTQKIVKKDDNSTTNLAINVADEASYVQPNIINLKTEELARSRLEYSSEEKERSEISHNHQGKIQDQNAKASWIKLERYVNSYTIHESEDKLPKIYQDELDKMDRELRYFVQAFKKIDRANEKRRLLNGKDNEKRKLKIAHEREQKRLKIANDKEQKRLKLLFDKELIRQASLNDDQRRQELWIKKNN